MGGMTDVKNDARIWAYIPRCEEAMPYLLERANKPRG
jgi:hypothetical protein